MSGSLGDLSVRIDLNTTAFQSGIATLNRNMNVLQSRFVEANSKVGNFGSNIDRLGLKSEKIAKAIDLQKEKVRVLEKAYEDSVNAIGKDAKATQDLEIRLNKTKAALNNMEQELVNTTKELEKQSSKWYQAGEKLKGFGDKAKSIGEKTSGIGQKLTMGLTLPILGVAGASVKLGNDFEAQMSRVKALTEATGKEFEDLRKQALDLGASTSFSASQVAMAQENLASAGFKTNQILDAMPGLLSLAASSGTDLASSAEIAAAAINGFGFEASQTGHVADVIAKAAADTNAGVIDMGMAFKFAAPLAKQAGISMEEVSAAVGIMSNAGIKGEMAGNALRSVMNRLAKPSNDAAAAMEKLGLDAFDSHGRMYSLSNIVGQLQKGMKGLTQEQKQEAMAMLFGSEMMSSMLVLVDAGPQKLANLTNSFKNCDGAAKKMADTMLDNTKGSIEAMNGSLETAGIKISQALAPSIKQIADLVGKLADKFSNLSPSTQKLILIFAGIVAAIGPLLLVIGNIIIIVGAVSSALGALGISFAAIAAPIGIAVGIIAGLIAVGVLLYKNWDKVKNFCEWAWNSIKEAINSSIQTAGNIINSVWNSITSFLSNIWNSIKNTASSVFNSILSVLTGIWNYIKGDVTKIWSGIQSYFSGVWNLIKNIFLGAVLIIVDLLSGNWEEAMNDAKKIWGNIKKAFQDIWKGISSVFSGALGLIKKFIETEWNGIKTVTFTVWNAIKAFFPALWNGIKSISSSALSAIKNAFTNGWNSVKTITSNLKESLIKTIKSIDLLQIGKDIIQGLINGITGMLSAVSKVATNLADTIKTKIKDALDIHSPSRVMQNEVGAMIPAGIAVGMNDKKNLVETAAKELANVAVPNLRDNMKLTVAQVKELNSTILASHSTTTKKVKTLVTTHRKNSIKEHTKYKTTTVKITQQTQADKLKAIEDYISKKQKAGQLDLAKEIATLEASLKHFKAGSQERLVLEKKIKDNKEKLNKDMYKSEKDWIDNKKKLNQLSTIEEIAAWEQVAKRYKANSEEKEEADEKAATLKKQIYDDLKQASEDYLKDVKEVNDKLIEDENRLNEEYQKALDDRTKALKNFAGLFDEVKDKEAISGDQLISNLAGQVLALKSWSDNMKILAQRGISEGLLQEIQDMGPQASVEVQALVNMSNTQLTQFQTLWQGKTALARNKAVEELSGLKTDTEKQIQELNKSAELKLTELQNTFLNKVKTLRSGVSNEFDVLKSTLPAIGVNAIAGLISGMTSMKGKLQSKATEMANIVKTTMQKALDIHSPSRVMALEVGKWIPAGVANGINDNIKNIELASINMKNATLQGSDISKSQVVSKQEKSVTNNNGITLHIENFVNNNDKDIENLAYELEAYRRKISFGRGMV